MSQLKVWSLLLGLGLILGAGTAAAQDDENLDHVQTCDEAGGATLEMVTDYATSRGESESFAQAVGANGADTLRGIALANSGVEGIDFLSLRDVSMVEVATAFKSQTADMQTDDVIAALALGISAEGESALEALACVSDISASVRIVETFERNVALTDDVVISVAALDSAGNGAALDLEDVATWTESHSRSVDKTHFINVDREDALLALALGAGGDDAAALS